MRLLGRLHDAATCETCRLWRRGTLVAAALLLATWWLT